LAIKPEGKNLLILSLSKDNIFLHFFEVNVSYMLLLQQLRSLSVGGAPLTAMLPALLALGPALQELRYTCYADLNDGQINFSMIAATCPNLKILAISGNALVYIPDNDNNLSTRVKYHRRQVLPKLRSVTINVHAYVPQHVWASLMTDCSELESLELTKCEALTDSCLLSLLAAEPASLTCLRRFCVRGTHRGDVKLTEKAVSALHRRSEQLDYVGDCYTWDLRTVSCTADQIRSLL
jgi:hypothetical protein